MSTSISPNPSSKESFTAREVAEARWSTIYTCELQSTGEQVPPAALRYTRSLIEYFAGKLVHNYLRKQRTYGSVRPEVRGVGLARHWVTDQPLVKPLITIATTGRRVRPVPLRYFRYPSEDFNTKSEWEPSLLVLEELPRLDERSPREQTRKLVNDRINELRVAGVKRLSPPLPSSYRLAEAIVHLTSEVLASECVDMGPLPTVEFGGLQLTPTPGGLQTEACPPGL